MPKQTPPKREPAGSARRQAPAWVLFAAWSFVARLTEVFFYTRTRAGGRRMRLGIIPVLGVVMALGAVTVISLSKPEVATAAPANTLNFQARLQTASGAIAGDGFYNVRFKLYDAATSGSLLWTETYLVSASEGIRSANGYLTAGLGTETAFPNSIPWGQQLYLTMEIGGTGTSPVWDGEMTPRMALTSVPSAFSLNTYNGSNGFSSSLSILQPTAGNQLFQIQDQGAAGTYNLCIANSSTCGFAMATGSVNYIHNQNASAQSAANFWISGTGKAATALQAPSFDSIAASMLNIGTTNATGITLGKTGVNTIVAGNLSVGTTSSYGAITIANGAWLTALDSAGTGSINMLSVNSNNEIQVGAALNIDGGIILPTDGGQMTFSDLPISASALSGAAQSYTLRVGSSNALTVYGEADGLGGVQNVRVAIGSSISPTYTLDVAGNARFTGRVIGANAVNNDEFVTLGQLGTGGTGDYIVNGTAVQIGANFNIDGDGVIGGVLSVQGGNDSYFSGSLGVGTSTPGAALHVVGINAAEETLVARAAATQTTNVLNVQDSTGVSIFSVKVPNGAYGSAAVTISGANRTNQPVLVFNNIGAGNAGIIMNGNSGGSFSISGFDNTPTMSWVNKNAAFVSNNIAYDSSPQSFLFSHTSKPVGNTEFVIRGQASQTGDMLQIQDSSSAVLAQIKAGGTINIATGQSYQIGSTDICTASGCTPAAGSANYIQNSTSVQAAANFNIGGSGTIGTTLTVSGTGNSSIAGKLGIGTTSPQVALHVVSGNNTFRFNDGAAGNTPNISISSSTGKSVALMVGTSGATFTFDSSGVFAIAGDTKANLDSGTSNGGTVHVWVTGAGNVGLGTISPSALLSLGGTGSSKGIVLGEGAVNAVNLYRSADDTLKTDDSLVIGTNLNVTGTTALSGSLTYGVASAGVLVANTSGVVSKLTGSLGQCLVGQGAGASPIFDACSSGLSGTGDENAIAKFDNAGNLTGSVLSDDGSTLTYTGSNLLLGTGGASPQATTIKAAPATGTNVKGGDLTIDASNGTGSGGSGDIILRTAAPAAGSGSPVVGTYTRSGNGNANQLTFSHTSDSGGNKLLLVQVVIQSNGASVSSVTYGGQALTNINAIGHNYNSNRVEMWYLLNPPDGAANVIVNLSAYRAVQAVAMNLTGVNQTTPFGTASSNQGSGNTASTSVTASNLDTVVSVVSSDSGAPTVGAGQTQIWNAQQGVYGAGSYAFGTGTVTASWTGSLNNWVIAAVPVLSSASSTADNILTEGIRVTNLGRVGINSSVPGAMLQVATNAAGTVGQILQGSAGQAADLLRLQDSAGNVNAAFSAAGNQLTLGRISTVGTVTQGKLVLADGTTDGFGLTLLTGTLTANRTLTLPDADGTLCTTATCGGGTGNVSYGTPTGDGIGTAYTESTILQNRIATIDSAGQLNASELGFGTGYLQYTGSGYALDLKNATTSTLTVKNSTVGQVANLSVTGAGSFTGALSTSSTLTTNGAITTTNNNITAGAGTISGATINATNTLQLGGADINAAGTLNNVAYLNQNNVFTSSATTQNAMTVNANSLTTGGGLKVSTTSSAITSGNLLEVSQNSTYASTFSSTNKLLNVSRNVTGPAGGTSVVTLDATSTSDVTGPFTTSSSWSHTVGSGSNRALIVTVYSNNGTPTSVTYTVGATTQNMTQIAVISTDDATNTLSQWILVAPTTGTGTITETRSAQALTYSISSSWTNVDQTTPYGTPASAYQSTFATSQTLAVTASATQRVVDAISFNDINTSSWNHTPGTGQTKVGTTDFIASSYKTGASSMSWTWSVNSDSVMIATPLNPSAGGSPGVIDGTLSGSVASISSSCLGCTETGSILNLQQANTLATGAVLSIQNSSAGPDILLGNGIIRPATNSTTAIRIQNANGTSNIVTIDSTNGRVGIGNVTDLSSGVLTVQATNDQASVLTLKNTSGTVTLEVRAGDSSNVLIGVGTGQNTTGGYNTALGYGALQQNTTGTSNVAVGYYAFQSATGGSFNTALGANALQYNSSGNYNIGVGQYSLGSNTSGSNNIALGQYTMYANQTGLENIALGHNALRESTAGTYNVALGYSALRFTGASYNVGLGYSAGYNNTTGSRNVFLGYQAGYNETGSDTLYIANNSTTALIQGDFANSALTFNSTLNLDGVANSATAFVIQRPSTADVLFTANTSNNRLIVGNGAGANANTTLFVLDKAASDPSSAQAGAMFYSTGTNTFRCYTSAWADCAGSGGGGSGWNLTGTNAAGSILGSNVATNAGFVISSRPNNVSATATGASYISFSGDQFSNPNRIIIAGNANSNSPQGGGAWSSTNTKDYFRIQDSSGQVAMAVQGSGGAPQVFMYLSHPGSVGVSGRVCSTLGPSTSGMATLATCSSSGTDLAEGYNSTQALEPGDIVAADPNNYPNVLRSTEPSQDNLIGIVSTEPNEVMGTDKTPEGYPIALNGRVPTKVNGEGGAILPGDKITSSSVPGVGKKATGPGMIVGTALTGFDGNGQGTIEVFVHLDYYEPAGTDILQMQNSGGAPLIINGSMDIADDLNVSGVTTLDTLHVTGSAVIDGELTVHGTVALVSLIVGGHVLSQATTPSVTTGSAAGQNGAVTIDGTDVAGTLSVTVGARPEQGDNPTETLQAGLLAEVTFLSPYELTPRIVISPTNQASVNAPVYLVKTNAGWQLMIGQAAVDGTVYQFDYVVVGSQGQTAVGP